MTRARLIALVRERTALARIGFHTFLVHGIDTDGECDCGDLACDPPSTGKHPFFSGGDRGATIDIGAIRRETQAATANLGVHCGLSNLVVIDVDPRNGGRETFATLQRQFPALEGAVIADTGGGGEHHYFRATEGVIYPATLGAGVDVLSGNKYPIIPPSRHYSGGEYRWRKGCDPVSASFLLTPLPDGVLDLCRGGKRDTPAHVLIEEGEAEIARVRSALACVPADCARNEWRDYLFALHSTGWECAEELAREWSMTTPELWSEPAFENIWKSANAARPRGRTISSIYYAAKRNGWVDPAGPIRADTLGDVANGRRFAERYRDKLIYDRASRLWREYVEGIWRPSDTGQHIAAGKAIADEIVEETGAAYLSNPTDKTRAAHSQALRVHRSAQRIIALIDMAAAEPGMSVGDPSAFDSDPYLLGVEGGAIDLRTGRWIAPSPALRISKCVGVPYDPYAKCPRFDAFLADILGGPEEVKFVQRAAGYSLTGSVEEEVLLYMQGAGANGKSVLANILSGVQGDYAATVGAELLSVTKNESEANRFKVRLQGLRMALVNEVGQNDTFNDQRLKEIVSREKIAARHLYGEAFDFMPSHKLWVRGNHRPAVLDSGDGMWRRLILLSFQRQFAPHERVRDLDRQLLEDEGSGILNWCIAGCLEWQKQRLNVPKSILRETAHYRNDTDIIGEWIATDCEERPGLRGSVIALFESYRRSCASAGISPRSKPAFVRMMTSRGYQRKTSNGVAYLSGIDLNDEL